MGFVDSRRHLRFRLGTKEEEDAYLATYSQIGPEDFDAEKVWVVFGGRSALVRKEDLLEALFGKNSSSDKPNLERVENIVNMGSRSESNWSAPINADKSNNTGKQETTSTKEDVMHQLHVPTESLALIMPEDGLVRTCYFHEIILEGNRLTLVWDTRAVGFHKTYPLPGKRFLVRCLSRGLIDVPVVSIGYLFTHGVYEYYLLVLLPRTQDTNITRTSETSDNSQPQDSEGVKAEAI